MLNPANLPQVQYELVTMAGGIDLVTPSYSLPTGALRDCLNFAVNSQGGYYRIPGYERFSGQVSPSLAQVKTFAVNFSGEPPVAGDNITINGVSAVCCGSGSDHIAVTKFSGTMLPGASIAVGPTVVGYVSDWYGALSPRLNAIYKAYATNVYRADIAPVPGSGRIRGVCFYKDVAYAWRNNAGGTACAIYKSTPAGWVAVPLMHRLAFTASDAVIPEGSTITKGGVTARVRRVQITSGQLIGKTAAGWLIIDQITGGSFSSGTVHPAGGGSLDLHAPEVAISIAPGGTYDMVQGNFTASADTLRIYGCDGVNPMFEFDGEVYVPIDIPGGVIPSHICVHRNHLFAATGASLTHSGVGQPYRYDVVDGAGEIGVGDRVTCLLVQPGSQSGSTLAVYGRATTWMLYGSSEKDWNFTTFNMGMGGIDFTAQNMAHSYVLDDRGVVSMQATLNYGNFDTATITHNIRPFIAAKRALTTASSVNRERSQYRVFFSDGYGLYCTIANEQPVGHGIVKYPDVVRCAFDGEYSTGDAVMIFGTDSGHVMRNDVGTSFDGAPISATLITNINTAKTPRIRKRFRRCVLEVHGYNYCEFSVGYNLEWASDNILQHTFSDAVVALSAAQYWDSFFWDNFYWDGRDSAPSPIDLNGTGENVQLILYSDSDFISEFSVNSAILHFTQRRGNR